MQDIRVIYLVAVVIDDENFGKNEIVRRESVDILLKPLPASSFIGKSSLFLTVSCPTILGFGALKVISKKSLSGSIRRTLP